MNQEEAIFESQEASNEILAKKTSPHPSSMEIKLSSIGKLSVPARVRVRDYNMDDATMMAMATEETQLGVLLNVVQGLIQDPGVDARMLHEYDLLEIMLTIYANFWNSTIDKVPYTWKEEELKGLPKARQKALREGKEKLFISISLNEGNIITKTLSPEFREPFVIRGKKDEPAVAFRMPRIGDTVYAQELIEEEFAYEEKEFEEVTAAEKKIEELQDSLVEMERELSVIPENSQEVENVEARGKLSVRIQATEAEISKTMKKLTPEITKAYRIYHEKKARRFLQAKQAQSLVAYGGIELKTDKEKLETYSKVPLQVWQDYAALMDRFRFGVMPTIKVKSPLTGGLVERAFRFRYVDFVPTPQSRTNTELAVSFGTIS